MLDIAFELANLIFSVFPLSSRNLTGLLLKQRGKDLGGLNSSEKGEHSFLWLRSGSFPANKFHIFSWPDFGGLFSASVRGAVASSLHTSKHGPGKAQHRSGHIGITTKWWYVLKVFFMRGKGVFQTPRMGTERKHFG